MALYLAAQVKKKTLVLVHKAFLKDQWAERVRQFSPKSTVTTVQGDACDTSGDVVVALIQTLLSRKYDPSVFEPFGLVIADEVGRGCGGASAGGPRNHRSHRPCPQVHHLGAAAFSQCMWGQCAAYTLGLSATPDRKDGLSRVVGWFVGPTAFSLKRENQASTVVKTVRYSCAAYDEPPPVNRRGDVCFPTVISRLTADEARTALVAAEAARLAGEGCDVLVLSHRRQHVADVAAAVRDFGVEAGTYVGGDKVCPSTQVIVATYALTSEGFDLPRLNALVLATPASDVEQSCGRVMRGSASRGATIVDVVDGWGVCFAQYAKRRGFYKRTGFTLAADEREQDPGPDATPAECAFLDDA